MVAKEIWEPSVKTLPFSTFRQTLEALRIEWPNLSPRFACLPEQGNENIKYLFPLSVDRPHNCRVYSRTSNI